MAMETKTQIRSSHLCLVLSCSPLFLVKSKMRRRKRRRRRRESILNIILITLVFHFTSHLRPFLLKIDKSIQNSNNYNNNNIACLIPVTYLIQHKRINFVKIFVKSRREILVVVFSIFTRERREMSRSS